MTPDQIKAFRRDANIMYRVPAAHLHKSLDEIERLQKNADQARRDQMEEDCKVVCTFCATGVYLTKTSDGRWFHVMGEVMSYGSCGANAIRRSWEKMETPR